MNISSYRPLLMLLFAALSAPMGQADTIDISKPIKESLKPDLLYFDFDQESEGSVPSKGELALSAAMEPGKVDAYPSWVSGRSEAFGKALAFTYGMIPPFTEPNNVTAGSHLSIVDRAELRLAGQSFTLGAWIKIPEDADLDLSWVRHKMLIGKGGYSTIYPGWGLQLVGSNNIWTLTLLLVSPTQDLMRCDAQIPGGLSPGDWRHVAASFDAGTRKISLWVDGVPAASRVVGGDVGESNFPLVIGERGMSTYSNIPVTMDEVFIVSGVHDFKPAEH